MKILSSREAEELERLSRFKQLDTKEKIRKWELEIKKNLKNDREHGWEMPVCGIEFVKGKGIKIEESYLYENGWTYDIPNNYEGIIITCEGRAFGFEFEYSKDSSEILESKFWDATADMNFTDHNRGIPKSRERVALEILKKEIS